MHPYLFDLEIAGHHLKPPTYGVLLATAFSVAYFESLRRARKVGEDAKHIENLFLLVVFSAVVGARMFHVIFEEPSYYLANPLKVFAVWEGGYTFHGALLLAMVSITLYCRKQKVSILQFMDIAAPATLMGLFIGRMGCFFAGCCWGLPSDLPWAVTFNHPDAFSGIRNVSVHPTQLYESFGCLLLYFFTQFRFRNRKYIGQIFFQSMIGYAILRFLIEITRGDTYRGFVGMISYAQLVCIGLALGGIAGMIYQSKLSKR